MKLFDRFCFALLVTNFSFNAAQACTYQATCTINNFERAGYTYSFDLLVRNSGTEDIGVRTSSFYFRHSVALDGDAITLTNTLAKYSSNGYSISWAKETETLFKVTVVNDSGVTEWLSATDEHLCTVNMRIANPSGTADLQWDSTRSGIRSDSVVTNILVGYDLGILPVTLASFTGSYFAAGDSVQLQWITLSELNNYGFDVQRRVLGNENYTTMGFVCGHGTTLEPQQYMFADRTIQVNRQYQYRLRQIDLDGRTHDSDPIIVSTSMTGVSTKAPPVGVAFVHNYPNPFNPTTTIHYGLPRNSFVTVSVYTTLGREVTRLVNEQQLAGLHDVVFHGDGLPSGLYVCRIQSGDFVGSKKLLLLK